MNFRWETALSLLLYMVLCFPLFAEMVDIPDPNLRAAVREALDLPASAVLTDDNLWQLRGLSAEGRNITTLDGLEHAIGLRELDLRRNNIEDLRPLAQLKNLRVLRLKRNNITDISPLSQLHRLEYLYLEHNKITDVQPLANLKNLVALHIEHNGVEDISSLDNLSLSYFHYDAICDMPALPLEPRIINRSYPSIFRRGIPIIANRPHASQIENAALNDLLYGPYFGLVFHETLKGITIGQSTAEALASATQQRDHFLSLNPNMIFIVEIRFRSDSLNRYPSDSSYWLRDANGDIIRAWTEGYGVLDFTHPDVQDTMVEQTIAVSKCGLYDGIYFDYWAEDYPVLVDDKHVPQRGLEAELRARNNILTRIRSATRPEFLITGNTNIHIIPRSAPYVNGGAMETVMPHARNSDEIERDLKRIETSLLWLDKNLRHPQINGLEAWSIPTEPMTTTTNVRWMRAMTTLSLTHSDGYSVYARGTGGSEHHWYDFWDADLGRPVGEKGQLYQRTEGLYIREFTNGWAVYNHSGEAQVITLPEEVQGVASGLVNTEHALPNLDGEIYLKKTAPTDSPGIDGSDIYITEPIHAVPGAALLLDASNSPGSIAHWVNLGAAGGRLLASDRLPTVEEGEIEIPAIGFSGRRRYYTATASGQTFGGPVHLNPQLYLGDWTLEFLCKRNGDLFSLEHHFAGFQNSPREGLQGIRLGLLLDDQELDMSIHADGVKQPTRSLNIFLEENVWTWVTIVSINGESIVAYQDGVEVSRHPGVHFDASLPINDISIGSYSYDERERNFNGSFSIVRVYDRALTPDEVLQHIGATVTPIANPADVNRDGVVNILDLVVVVQRLGTDKPEADVNRDGVVNVLDLVQVAGEIGGGGAAPSAYSLDPAIISAADVERWLALAQGLGGDANFQRGIRFLQHLLATLTPKETTLLPNYPNPFNPETWIPYNLASEAEVAITIYDTKGTLVRRLALGNQAAGYYAERGKAAYWDGRNEHGEAVASGIYIYQFRAGDYVASRRMVIVK